MNLAEYLKAECPTREGVRPWAEELNQRLRALRYAMDVEQSHNDEVSLWAQEIKP